MALAGNKADIAEKEPEKRKVDADEAQAYADENGLFFMETSARTAANVNDLFYEIARKLPRAEPPTPAAAGVTLSAQRQSQRPKSQCC